MATASAPLIIFELWFALQLQKFHPEDAQQELYDF